MANTLEECFTDIYKYDIWNMGQSESKSGLGSTLDFTENIRSTLINFIDNNSIRTMLDTSCGDWNWMRLIKDKLCNYTGIDIVKDIVTTNNTSYANDHIQFIHDDFLHFIKNQPNNSYDLILCRHTLEHLPTEYNLEFINECKRVCKFLFVTTYNRDISNRNLEPNTSSPYRPINLKKVPYSVLEPYYYSQFYDGSASIYHSEMYMNIYNFTSLNDITF